MTRLHDARDGLGTASNARPRVWRPAQARGLTQRIRLLRIKDRFAAPTSGGWADVLVNFVFEDDATKHVVELQLQHNSLLLVRKEGEGHQAYNEFRSAFELLEAVGKAPMDAFEDATTVSDVPETEPTATAVKDTPYPAGLCLGTRLPQNMDGTADT